jgi:hypothetical protein
LFCRGVIVRDINHNGAVLNYNTDMMSPPKDYQPVQEGYKRPSITTASLSNAGKKVADKFASLTSAVGHGLSGIVDTILDTFEEDEDGGVNSPEGNPLFPAIKGGTSSTGSSGKVNTASRASEYDYEDEDISPSNMKKQISGDPLLGVENVSARPKKSPAAGSTTAYLTSSSPENGNPSPPHLLNGMGKGYANLPGDAVDPLTILGSPGQPKPKASSSLFSPNWFPSSSSSSSSTAPSSSTKHKMLDKDTEKGSRLSVGVNLSLLHSHSEDVASKNGGSDSVKTGEKVAAKKRNSKHQENAVGDRLLDLSDELMRISHISHPSSHANNGNDVMTTRESLDDGNDVLTATAKRLQGLVDVLSGITNIVDYDTKYGNRALPQPPLKPMYISSTSSTPSITTPAVTVVTLPSPPTPKAPIADVVLPRPRPSVTTVERNQDNDML